MKSDSMKKNDAIQINFARKHEEDLRRLRGLRLLDDDCMQKVFEDKACTELLLQIILKRADLKVLHVKGQQDIKNLQGRSVTLDILAVDTDNKVYNIEIQRSDKGAAVKRARYNSSRCSADCRRWLDPSGSATDYCTDVLLSSHGLSSFRERPLQIQDSTLSV